jgi:radical SAM superfamily enzyme YgiQ (UPF0313 family)
LRLLFISPNRLRLIVPPLPLGLASLVAAMEAEPEVAVLDFMFADDPLGELSRTLADFTPDLIAVSLRNLDNQDSRNPITYFPEVKDLMAQLRRESGAPIVLGGPAFSIVPQPLMEYLEAEFGVVGEGEEAFAAFLAAYQGQRPWPEVPGLIRQEGGRWQQNPPHRVNRLEKLPPPALGYFTPRLYQGAQGSAKLPGMIPVQSRRGCPMRCIYCTTRLLEGRQVRAWPPEQVASWLATWHEQWGLTRFYFVDNIFNHPLEYARQLSRAIKGLKLPLEWGCLINPAFPDRELFGLLREAGCGMVQVGNESGSELVLRRLGKGFGRQQVELTLGLLKEEGLLYNCFLLLGGPGETRETVRESVALLEAYNPHMVNLTVGVRIYPGLPLHRQALAEGMVAPQDNLLWPRFYLASDIRGWIWEYLKEVTGRHPNWIF